MRTINLIYIGERFYRESSTEMSSLFVENTWERYDWNLVCRSFENNICINIRPANKNEMKIAELKLQKIKQELGL